MRILHVTTGLTTGGAQVMLLKLLSNNNGDWEPAVVSLMDEGTIGPRIAALGIPVHCLGLRRGRPNPVRALSVLTITRQFRPQLIQGWMYHGNLVASLASVSMHRRMPVLWNIRQSLEGVAEERRLTRAMIRLGALLSWHPASIIYNSPISARQHEIFGYRASRRVVIPNGFDCQIFRPDNEARRQVREELGIGIDTILIGLIARFHPVKDHASFLRAANLVARTHPHVRFLLVGDGVTVEERALTKLIREQRLESRIFLLGERPDTPRLTAALDIACSASMGEGFSNTIGEAMACGVPCVVTDVGDSALVVANTGLSVRPSDPEALAQAIEHLVDVGPEQRRQLGVAARRRIQTEFSLPTIAHRYEDLYREHVGTALYMKC
jgi:glycosyltransferase involved in cell wall biosynthesis